MEQFLGDVEEKEKVKESIGNRLNDQRQKNIRIPVKDGTYGFRKELRGDGMERVSTVGYSRYMKEVMGGGVEYLNSVRKELGQ